MKRSIFTVILSILFTQNSLTAQQPAQAQQPEINTKFANILPHLDTNGSSLNLSIDTDLIEISARTLDNLYGPAMRMTGNLQNFNIPQTLKTLGLHGITATGSSSKKHAHKITTKLFIQSPNIHHGILSIFDTPRPFTGQNLAPENTDILLETQLNLEKFPQTIAAIVSQADSKVGEQLVIDMTTPIPGINSTAQDFISKLNPRITIIATVGLNGGNISKEPTLKASVNISQYAALFWNILTKEMPDLEFQTQGNIHTFTLPDVIPDPIHPEQFIPITFLFDLDTDQIWITISPDHLQQCRSSQTKKLRDSEAYKLITHDLPTTGCSQLYLSKPFTHNLSEMVVNSLGFTHNPKAPNKVMVGITQIYQDIASNIKKGNGISSRLTKTKQGIYTHTNAPFRIRSSGVLTAIIGSFNAIKSMNP